MTNSKTVVVVIVAVLVAASGTVVLLSPNALDGLFSSANNNVLSTDTTTVVATSEQSPPVIVLTILKDDEDNSIGAERHEANNSEPIVLAPGQHIRFESPDYRIPDSMKIIAISQSGTIHTLLKSYDVNNEFFAKLEKGSYELRVQATWFELGTQFYFFNVTIK